MRLAACITAAWLVAAGARAEGLDTAKLDEARSLVAEAVALRDAEASGRLTRPYAAGLREDLRDSLEKLLKTPGVADVARQALIAIDRGDRPTLVALRDRLVALERANGRAG